MMRTPLDTATAEWGRYVPIGLSVEPVSPMSVEFIIDRAADFPAKAGFSAAFLSDKPSPKIYERGISK